LVHTVSETKENYGKLKQKSQGLETKLEHCLLLSFLNRYGLVTSTATLDDVLNLKIEDLLERRLQTIIMRKTGTRSPHQARQIVVHGHVAIGNRIVNLPGYLVKSEEESQIMALVEVQPSQPAAPAAAASAGAPSRG
jgi:small subunit ribosomal protein S4